MRKPRLIASVAVTAGVLLATGCSHDDNAQQAPDNASPKAAVMTSVSQLKAGHFDALMQNLLPPADYKTMRADWSAHRGNPDKITPAQRQRFAEQMHNLTEPGAKAKLYQDLKPRVAAYNSKYKAQLPMMVGIGQTVVDTQLDNSKTLTLTQKKQAKDVIAALGGWAKNAPWGDQAKAKQAVGVVVDTARQVDIKTFKQAYALNYDQAMAKYGQIWGGAKQLLAIYGLSIDKALDSVKAKTVDNDGHVAHVRVDYQVLDKPMSTQLTMIELDGHWYDQDVLNNWRREHAKQTAAASAASTAAEVVDQSAPPAASTPGSSKPAVAASTH
ncbi:hypothetical protein [Oleiagrimonas sp. C23AA]|uniref:hypothetical protein n=1 Tax=Oleiagrimonas sp. C23AA TaxID=2719047 RepID=UPI00142213A0|nr:hypothetical protein [Oleiagrimonas sp. C23AA]NII10750.1 hypothetical protein [Oleiagrimonas sp. C23AA]